MGRWRYEGRVWSTEGAHAGSRDALAAAQAVVLENPDAFAVTEEEAQDMNARNIELVNLLAKQDGDALTALGEALDADELPDRVLVETGLTVSRFYRQRSVYRARYVDARGFATDRALRWISRCDFGPGDGWRELVVEKLSELMPERIREAEDDYRDSEALGPGHSLPE